MYLWFRLCIFLAVTFDLAPGSLQEGGIGYPKNSGGEIKDGKRSKRALYGILGKGMGIMKGLQTARTLLNGAKHLYTMAQNTKVYVKKGDYRTAKQDFKSAHLSAVEPFELPGGVKGRIGESGDRIVTIQTYGESGYPTMKIIQQSMSGIKDVDVVVYVK